MGATGCSDDHPEGGGALLPGDGDQPSDSDIPTTPLASSRRPAAAKASALKSPPMRVLRPLPQGGAATIECVAAASDKAGSGTARETLGNLAIAMENILHLKDCLREGQHAAAAARIDRRRYRDAKGRLLGQIGALRARLHALQASMAAKERQLSQRRARASRDRRPSATEHVVAGCRVTERFAAPHSDCSRGCTLRAASRDVAIEAGPFTAATAPAAFDAAVETMPEKGAVEDAKADAAIVDVHGAAVVVHLCDASVETSVHDRADLLEVHGRADLLEVHDAAVEVEIDDVAAAANVQTIEAIGHDAAVETENGEAVQALEDDALIKEHLCSTINELSAQLREARRGDEQLERVTAKLDAAKEAIYHLLAERTWLLQERSRSHTRRDAAQPRYCHRPATAAPLACPAPSAAPPIEAHLSELRGRIARLHSLRSDFM